LRENASWQEVCRDSCQSRSYEIIGGPIMAKRITIVIDDDLDKKIRLIQAKIISSTASSMSYSRVINDILRKNLKK